MAPQARDEGVRVAEMLLEAFNSHDLTRLKNLVSESFFGLAPDTPEPWLGHEGGRTWAEAMLGAFPDARLIPERIFGHDSTFVAQVVFEGTHTGPLEAPRKVPPTYRTVRFAATFVGRAKDGKLLDLRGYWDQASLFQQLGTASAAPPARV